MDFISTEHLHSFFEGFFNLKELDLCKTSPESSTEWHMHISHGLQSEMVYTVHPAVVNFLIRQVETRHSSRETTYM